MTPKRKVRLSWDSKQIKEAYLETEAQDETFLHPLEKKYREVEDGLRTEKDPALIEHYSLMKIVLSTRIKLEYLNRALLLMLLLLSGRVDSIETQMTKGKKSKLDKREQEAEDKFDTHVAKRLSQLLDMKGHEGMYDTGTKPSRSN